MEQLRALLEEQRGEISVEDWVFEINRVLQPADNERLRATTLYSYLSGNRNIVGNKGARLLAQYFYKKGNFTMVDAISQVTLGIPYPAPNGAPKN